MKEDPSKNANNHISRVTNLTYANSIINKLLEDIIVSVCNIVLENEDKVLNLVKNINKGEG